MEIPWLGRSMNLCLITFSDFSSVTFRLVADDYVMNDSGTGIVHCAPVFGADDYRVCLENEIIKKVRFDNIFLISPPLTLSLFSFLFKFTVSSRTHVHDTFCSCVVQIVRDFKRPDGLKDTEIDAAVDSTYLN